MTEQRKQRRLRILFNNATAKAKGKRWHGTRIQFHRWALKLRAA